MRHARFSMSIILLMCLLAAPGWAQDDTCPAIVQSALAQVSSACEATGRNEVV